MTLWTPTRVGAIDLPHRLAMAPMTRDRSRADGVPTDLNREYYTQRASMALIITEGTQPSADGQGYLLTPGIYTADHIDGWRAAGRAWPGGPTFRAWRWRCSRFGPVGECWSELRLAGAPTCLPTWSTRWTRTARRDANLVR